MGTELMDNGDFKGQHSLVPVAHISPAEPPAKGSAAEGWATQNNFPSYTPDIYFTVTEVLPSTRLGIGNKMFMVCASKAASGVINHLGQVSVAGHPGVPVIADNVIASVWVFLISGSVRLLLIGANVSPQDVHASHIDYATLNTWQQLNLSYNFPGDHVNQFDLYALEDSTCFLVDSASLVPV
jgi:hypothetical protein